MKVHTTEHPFTTGVDISSHEFWMQAPRERDATFARLRREAPVSWHPPLTAEGKTADDYEEAGFWAITRHADINHVSQHHELFTSTRGINTRPPEATMLIPGRTLLGMDPPDHTHWRNMMSVWFTPKGVAKLSDKIEERAETIVSDVVGAGEFDFVDRVSSQLPMLTIADMVGVPESQIPAFTQAGNDFVNSGSVDPTQPGEKDPQVVAFESVKMLSDIGLELVADRRKHPADDIATGLALAEADGEPLTDADIVTAMVVLSIAGNDTTKHSTSWTALNLWENPDQAAWLREDYEGRIGLAVEEFVRHASPVQSFARTATQDIELGGAEITAGDKVIVWYRSGNRDETVFPDPERFDLSRPRTNHVAFGGRGAHYCLGNVVAKAQLRAIFRQVLTKLPDLEVTGEPEFIHSEFFNGIRRLPVRVS